MSEKCNCGCCFNWFSGLFAAPAIMNLIRVLEKWDISFRGNPIEMKTSWIIVIVCGILSVIFGIIGCKKHKGTEVPKSTCCS